MQYEILLIIPHDKTMILSYETLQQAQNAISNINIYKPEYNGAQVTATPLNFLHLPKSSVQNSNS